MPPESGGADSQRAVDCGMKSAAFGLLADADLDHPSVEVAGTAKCSAGELFDEAPAARAGMLEAFILRFDWAVLQQTLQFVNFLGVIIYYYRINVKCYRSCLSCSKKLSPPTFSLTKSYEPALRMN